MYKYSSICSSNIQIKNTPNIDELVRKDLKYHEKKKQKSLVSHASHEVLKVPSSVILNPRATSPLPLAGLRALYKLAERDHKDVPNHFPPRDDLRLACE